MLFCFKCFEKIATFFDGSAFYQWCDNCVPRGCSCNEDYLCISTNPEIVEDRIDIFLNLKNSILNSKDNFKLYYSDKGLLFCQNTKDYYIESSSKNNNLELIDNDFFLNDTNLFNHNSFFKNNNHFLKIVDIDDTGKEIPCCEIFYTDKQETILESRLYSMKYNKNVVVQDRFEDSFSYYLDKDKDSLYISHDSGINISFDFIDFIFTEDTKNTNLYIFLSLFIVNTEHNMFFMDNLISKEFINSLNNPFVSPFSKFLSIHNYSENIDIYSFKKIRKNIVDFIFELFEFNSRVEAIYIFQLLSSFHHLMHSTLSVKNVLDKSDFDFDFEEINRILNKKIYKIIDNLKYHIKDLEDEL